MSDIGSSQSTLPLPHGGTLIDLYLSPGEAAKLSKQARQEFPSLTLTQRQLCDVELLLNGGFSPLTGFLNEEAYHSVVKDLRLPNGLLWPIPITLDITSQKLQDLKVEIGKQLSLKDDDNNIIAILTVESIYKPDKKIEAKHVFGSEDDVTHPSIKYLFEQVGDIYIGGTLRGLQRPLHFDFLELRLTPKELREKVEKLHWKRVVAFQTRNPMHRSHRELTLRAARDAKANVLLHPVVGMTKPGDVDHYTRVRCYMELLKHYPTSMATLSLLPLAMRMAGPREALWHTLIRKNFGATHFIVGRDHAGPGNNKDGKPFYEPYAAHELVLKHEGELGVKILTYKEFVFVEDRGEYLQQHEVPEGSRVLSISGTELRRRLNKGIAIPDWFTYPEVVKILRQAYPQKSKQGFTIFFTGLSGAGKSTLAKALLVFLLQDGSRPVTMLDGDEIRQNLSVELGFSKQARDMNIKRIGYVAGLITKSRGACIISAIAPYEEVREAVRKEISQHGGFILVHVATSLEVCEERDVKNLYARARRGEIKNFTGIDDPYEPPRQPEIYIDTSKSSVIESLHEIILFLEAEGYLVKSD